MSLLLNYTSFKLVSLSLITIAPIFFLCLKFLMLLQGTVSFLVGFFLVIIGWPILGMIVEAYGFIVLFRYSASYPCKIVLVLTLVSSVLSLEVLIIYLLICSGFWPTLTVFLQKMPIVGWLFQQPFIRSVILFCCL